jgi:hypothetical protein
VSTRANTPATILVLILTMRVSLSTAAERVGTLDSLF